MFDEELEDLVKALSSATSSSSALTAETLDGLLSWRFVRCQMQSRSAITTQHQQRQREQATADRTRDGDLSKRWHTHKVVCPRSYLSNTLDRNTHRYPTSRGQQRRRGSRGVQLLHPGSPVRELFAFRLREETSRSQRKLGARRTPHHIYVFAQSGLRNNDRHGTKVTEREDRAQSPRERDLALRDVTGISRLRGGNVQHNPSRHSP